MRFRLAYGIKGILLAFVFLPVLVSGELAAGERLPIGRITIEGLKRTRIATVCRILNLQKGILWTPEARELAERRLRNFGTFTNISIEESVREEHVDLLIHLEDRWTLFPFPVFTTGSGSSYGLGIFERNFLGRQKNVGAIFLIKQRKPRLFVLYNDPHFLSWNWELIVTAGFSEDSIVDFIKEQTTASASLRYRFSDYFSLLGGLRTTRYRHAEGAVTPIDGDSWRVLLEAEYNRLLMDEDYFQGASFQAAMDHDLGFSDFAVTRFRAKTALYHRAFADHTLAANAWISLSDKTPYGFGYVLGGKGARDTLPVKGYRDNEFIADQVLSGNLEYRIPVFKSRGFILSAVGFTDYAFFADTPSRIFSGESMMGLGMAVRLYVRRVAVPAFQLYGTYLPKRDIFEIGFSVGAGPGRR